MVRGIHVSSSFSLIRDARLDLVRDVRFGSSLARVMCQIRLHEMRKLRVHVQRRRDLRHMRDVAVSSL